VLEFRATDAVLNFINAKDLARLSQAGVVTPDHTIRTKNWPLVLPPPDPGKLAEFAQIAHDSNVGILLASFVAAALQDGCKMQSRHGANHRGMKSAPGKSKSDEANFNHLRILLSKRMVKGIEFSISA